MQGKPVSNQQPKDDDDSDDNDDQKEKANKQTTGINSIFILSDILFDMNFLLQIYS